jgi:hypothetical protein
LALFTELPRRVLLGNQASGLRAFGNPSDPEAMKVNIINGTIPRQPYLIRVARKK